jgi:hypothetical protein
MRLVRKTIFLSLLLSAFFLPSLCRADTVFNLAVTPAVIDVPSCEKGQICLEKTVSIKNNSAVRADVYAQVNDLSPTAGIIPYADPSQLPADASLVRWIDFYRSVIEIDPGQTATETLTITASPDAQPGTYHAILSFPTGGNLTEAQVTDQTLNVARVQIDLNLVAHQVEQAEINRFEPVTALFTRNVIGFNLKIKNIGNEPVTPAGEIIVYDKGGREVGSLTIASSSIAANEIKDFSTQGKLNIGPGKFKALLDLNYGQDNGKNLTDIVYFSYLPLTMTIILLVLIIGALYGAAIMIHKKRKGKKSVPEKNRREETPSEPQASHHKHHKYVINLKK